MSHGPEYTLVEKPIIDILKGLGYDYLKPEENVAARDGLNNVILRDVFVRALMRINGVDKDTARAVYLELLSLADNERWTYYLRGNYSRKVPGETTYKTIRLVDFLNWENNRFTVANQFKVRARNTRIPDVVCFVNGLPLVVIEAKSPVSFKNKMGAAFEQIKLYEGDIEKLFATNLFNIITDGKRLMYGASGAASAFWGRWRDPWQKKEGDFDTELEKGCWCLLEPSRLLDILAHFVVFEKEDNKTVKKICRYQQFRAVNKIVGRVLENRKAGERKGLVWHTQGSGKSLTMVFATLKLKSHLTIESDALASPDILVLTDRIDLDEQISKTFAACRLRNPKRIESKEHLLEGIHSGGGGVTLLSTIFKFEHSRKPVKNSSNWILLVDECHRTQEKDLGAYLRATFPDAWFFGFTGTPIKKTDKDTYRNFSPPGESYLDKYSMDDAVRDGATVPILYTSRKVELRVDPKMVDIKFDHIFADLSKKRKAEIRKKLTFATVLKHEHRVEIIAMDIWEHFKSGAMKDGYKAQVVAYDREAVILYKRALDKVIARDLEKSGKSLEEAIREAQRYSTPVYSSNQEDEKPSEDPWLNGIRGDLVRYRLDEDKKGAGKNEGEIKDAFKAKGRPPWFLIVCSKLLTGFDAPAEAVMYLDNPLREHNLLQAIARTNRVEGPGKQHGLVVDYVGVTAKLSEALASYRSEDVQNAMHDLESLGSELKRAHADVMQQMKSLKKRAVHPSKEEYTTEFHALIDALETVDRWLDFKARARRFIRLYEALSPDPAVLEYKRDLKWVSFFLAYASHHFEQEEFVDIGNCSAKIREILEEELTAAGLRDVVTVRSLADKAFWDDFVEEGKSEAQLASAAMRKATELKRAIAERLDRNREQYMPFSIRLMNIIRTLNEGQAAAARMLKGLETLSNDLLNEEKAHEGSGLSKNAHGVYKILEAFRLKEKTENPTSVGEQAAAYRSGLDTLQKAAREIDRVYASDETAPRGWHLKGQMKKELRGKVRRIVHPLKVENWKAIPEKVEAFALKHYKRN